MQLTIHLFDHSADGFDSLLAEPAVHKPQQPRLSLDFSCVAVWAFRHHDRPIWADYVDDYFDVDWAAVVTSSLVLLVHTADRYFAVTFGQGRHLLRSERLVADFGLRVTANCVAGDTVAGGGYCRAFCQFSTHHTTRIGAEFSRRLLHRAGTRVVRDLSGWTDEDLTRRMTGSQSLRVELEPSRSDLKRLHELLEYMLKRYYSKDYQEFFGFLDALSPLPCGDPRVAALDARLRDTLRAGADGIGIMVPNRDPDNGDRVASQHLILRRRRSPIRLDRLGLRNLHAWMGSRDPLRLTVRAVGTDGERLRERKLREFLTAEVKLAENEIHVLAEGSWFAVDGETANQRRRDVAEIRELPRGRMPPWWTNHQEGTYNEEVAEQSGWRLLDKKNFQGVVRNRDLVEICDLLTPAMYLVCGKRLRNATGISHLFAQGAVSATLYWSDRDYREHIERLFRERWSALRPPETPRVVYAMGFDGSGSVRGRLPFFSRIDLRNQAKVVRAAGFRVALCQIRITQLREPVAPVRPPLQRRAEAEQPPGQGQLFSLG